MSADAAANHPADARLPRNCTFNLDDWQKLAKHWYPVPAPTVDKRRRDAGHSGNAALGRT
jgi:hypothetical protein